MLRTSILVSALTSVLVCVSSGQDVEKVYTIEGFRQEGDTTTLVLKFKEVPSAPAAPVDKDSRLPRQEEEDEDDVPATTPFIPAIIPGITKIFNGILTGNLNEIFHGSTSFAPKNVSHAIDSVYNTVVGLPLPITTVPTTAAPLKVNVTAAPTEAAAAASTASPDDEDEDSEPESDLLTNPVLRTKRNIKPLLWS